MTAPTVRGPLPEPPLEPGPGGLGTQLAWAFRALQRHIVPLLLVSLVLAGVWLVTGLVVFLIGLVVGEIDVEAIYLIGVWAMIALSIAVVVYTIHALIRTWHAAVTGSVPDLGWVLRPDRFVQATGAFLLLLPLWVLPLGGGFAMVALYYAIAERLSPVAALSEMISRCTADARAFWRTVLLGFLVLVYAYALSLATFSIWGLNSSLAIVDSVDNFFATSETDDLSIALGVLISAGIAIPLTFGFSHVTGLWHSAWARHLAGRPVGSADGSTVSTVN